MTLTRIAGAVLFSVLFADCASGGRPTPDAVFRHPTIGDVQWCDKGSAVAAAVGGALVAASQGAGYADCKTGLESKGYLRLDSSARLSPENQQRYEAERERAAKARADSIRKN